MPSKLTLLGSALLAWAVVAALCALPLAETRWAMAIIFVALAAGTGGLVLSIVGAAMYERY